MKEVYSGNIVIVTTADGQALPRRAVSGVIQGTDFPVILVATEAEWLRAKSQNVMPQSLPWPAESVNVAH